jgi:predicted negative regulator of RcsB-dependent stress response
MSFLYPLAWLGALAVAFPIWLHLRRREESNLVRFSAMRFLEDQPLARRRPLLPRDWPLLLLRVLALILLVAAFTWPYWQRERAAIIRESRVYVLDRTMSAHALERFDQSRDRLVKELTEKTSDVQMAVVELTSFPRVLMRFGDDSRNAAAAIKQLEATHQRGSYLSAFRMANQLLDQSLGAKKSIVLLGDSQQNQW